MPNWCCNNVTLSNEDSDKIDAFVVELEKPDEEQKPFQFLRPRPASEDETWYGWNCDNWGTKWDVSIYQFERQDDNTILIHFDSAWSPPIAMYEYLESEGWTVNAMYYEPGMNFAGIYSDGDDDYYELNGSADELESFLPSDLDDAFGISDSRRQQEEDDAYEEQAEIENEWERTDWFSKKVKPVREGTYEIKTKKWPFPHKADWENNQWMDCFFRSPIKGVTEWRGLTEGQHKDLDMDNKLEELLDTFDKIMENESEE
jgi:hypothetical protein